MQEQLVAYRGAHFLIPETGTQVFAYFELE